jgi:hypothetical protein
VSDDEAGAAISEEIGRIDALLLGRKTYDKRLVSHDQGRNGQNLLCQPVQDQPRQSSQCLGFGP